MQTIDTKRKFKLGRVSAGPLGSGYFNHEDNNKSTTALVYDEENMHDICTINTVRTTEREDWEIAKRIETALNSFDFMRSVLIESFDVIPEGRISRRIKTVLDHLDRADDELAAGKCATHFLSYSD